VYSHSIYPRFIHKRKKKRLERERTHTREKGKNKKPKVILGAKNVDYTKMLRK
jgi:hypothetical protein